MAAGSDSEYEYEYEDDAEGGEGLDADMRGRPRKFLCCYSKSAQTVLEMVANDFGWRFEKHSQYKKDLDKAHVFFCGKDDEAMERGAKLKPKQRLCRIPVTGEICQKIPTARMLQRASRLFPGQYAFNPDTWLLPEETGALRAAMEESPKDTFIVKPTAGSQGDGIFLAMSWADLELKQRASNLREAVVQRYVCDPLLIDGCKFDLRLYVIVTSVEPLRVFLCREGLARLCTEPYEEPTRRNLHKAHGHLTNYSLNKRSEKFTHSKDDDGGTSQKRAISAVFANLAAQGVDTDAIWASLDELVFNTATQMAPALAVAQRKLGAGAGDRRFCQIMGFDVLLGSDLAPHLLEINASPSLSVDSDHNVDANHPLPAGQKLCRGACMIPGPHYHEAAPVDVFVKKTVLKELLACAMRADADVADSTDICVAINPPPPGALSHTDPLCLLSRLVPILAAISPRDNKVKLSQMRSLTTKCALIGGDFTVHDLDILFKRAQIARGPTPDTPAIDDFDMFATMMMQIASKRNPVLSAHDALVTLLADCEAGLDL